jgi:phosphate:Na+ symporter
MLEVAISILTGLGLFFCGIRLLATYLTLAAFTSARRLFRHALGSTWLTAGSGVLSGLLTQSTNAVALIVVSFARAGIVSGKRVPLLPAWSHVGASALVFIVALDTESAVALLLFLCGVVWYFDLRLSEHLRNLMMAVLGGSMLLLGLAMLKTGSAPLQLLLQDHGLLRADSPAWSTLLIGLVLALATQSSTVAGAIAVALVAAGVFDLDTALLLLLGANAGSGLNYAFLARQGEATGRHILFFQAAQKLVGLPLLLLPLLFLEGQLEALLRLLPTDDAHRLATAFLMIQLVGSLLCTIFYLPLGRKLDRIAPPRREDVLAKPAFLADEALGTAELALELADKESQRLLQRLPLMLERLRVDGDPTALEAGTYRRAAELVAEGLRRYLETILERQQSQQTAVHAMYLQKIVDDTVALHQALDEFSTAAAMAVNTASGNTTVTHMIESLHLLLTVLVDAASSEDADDQEMALTLLAQRNELMEGLRKRLLGEDSQASPKTQEALFKTTVLFERILWLARDGLMALRRLREEKH